MSGAARIIRILRPEFPKDYQGGLVVVGFGTLLTIILEVFVAPVAWLFLISIIFLVVFSAGLYLVERTTSQITITEAGFTEVYFGVTAMSYSWADVGEFVVDTYLLKPTVSFVDHQSRKRLLGYGRIFVYCGDLETLAAVLNEARTNYASVPADPLPVSR